MGNIFSNLIRRREAGVPQSTTEGAGSQPVQGADGGVGASYASRVVSAGSPQAALTVSGVYRATELISKTLGLMPVQYRKRDWEAGNPVVDMRGAGRRINYLLQEEPNPTMTAASLWQQVHIRRILQGNGFVYVERDELDFPVALWLVQSGAYDVVSGRYDLVYLGEHGYVSLAGVPRSDVLHFPNTFRYENGVWGVATLRYALDTLSTIRTLKQQSLETAAKGGRVKLIIGEEKPASGAGTLAFGLLAKDQMDSYAKEINNKIYQQDVVAIRGLDKVQNISMSATEMQLVEQLGMNLDDVARFWGVPRPLLMLDSNSHYNDYQNATMEFHTRTILPLKNEMEKEIMRKLIGFKDYGARDIHVCETPLLAMDPERQAKVDELSLRTGAKTVNEIRAAHDMPSVENGDIVYVSTNLAELGSEKLRLGAGGGAGGNEKAEKDDEDTK